MDLAYSPEYETYRQDVREFLESSRDLWPRRMGLGFTDLMGLHFWFKRIGFNRQVLGSPERAREDAARVQGWQF